MSPATAPNGAGPNAVSGLVNQIDRATTPWDTLRVSRNADADAIDAAFQNIGRQIQAGAVGLTDAQAFACMRASRKAQDARDVMIAADGAVTEQQLRAFQERWSISVGLAIRPPPTPIRIDSVGGEDRRFPGSSAERVAPPPREPSPSTSAPRADRGSAPTSSPFLSKLLSWDRPVGNFLYEVGTRLTSVVSEFTNRVQILRWLSVPATFAAALAPMVLPRLESVANFLNVSHEKLASHSFGIALVGPILCWGTAQLIYAATRAYVQRDIGALLEAVEIVRAEDSAGFLKDFKTVQKRYRLEGRDLAILIPSAVTDPDLRLNAARNLLKVVNSVEARQQGMDKLFKGQERDLRSEMKRDLARVEKDTKEKIKNKTHTLDQAEKEALRAKDNIAREFRKAKDALAQEKSNYRAGLSQEIIKAIQELRGVGKPIEVTNLDGQGRQISFAELVHRRFFFWLQGAPQGATYSWRLGLVVAESAVAVVASHSIVTFLASRGW